MIIKGVFQEGEYDTDILDRLERGEKVIKYCSCKRSTYLTSISPFEEVMQTIPNKVLDSVVRWTMHLSQLRKSPVFKCD